MNQSVLVWGGTGQAKVVRPIIENHGYVVVAVYDRNPDVPPPFEDVPFLRGKESLEAWLQGQHPAALSFVVAVGGSHGFDRCEIGAELSRRGMRPLTLVHDRAWVAASASLAEGCQILAMAVVGELAKLGPYCIVNTNASVDHECRLGRGVHVMPGATIAGCVQIGDCVTIGSNATVLPRIRIGERAVIGAGAVVTRDVASGTTVIGSPARPRNSSTR